MKNDILLIKLSRKEALDWAKKNLVGQTVSLPDTGTSVLFTMRGIKEAINQPHRSYIAKNDAIRQIVQLISTVSFVKQEPNPTRPEYSFRYYKTILPDEESFIVIRENHYTGIQDFYSLVDKIKE